MLEKILEYYGDDVEILKADGFDDAIIGVVDDYNEKPRLVYSISKCLKILEAEGMSDIDALEYFEFNVEGAYVGEQTPIWCQDEFY